MIQKLRKRASIFTPYTFLRTFLAVVMTDLVQSNFDSKMGSGPGLQADEARTAVNGQIHALGLSFQIFMNKKQRANSREWKEQ